MTDENNKSEDVIESSATETTDVKQTSKTKLDKSPEIFSRLFYTILFFIIGWVSLWIFSFVVVIQFGFMLITGQVNTNLKGFNKEVGLFLFDLMKYLSFQANVKPFPFRDWPYDEIKNNSKLNETDTVKPAHR